MTPGKRRGLVWALRGVGLLLVAYWLAANVLLGSRMLRDAVSGSRAQASRSGAPSPPPLTLDYASAYSIVPGRVHVRGLELRGRERTVEWALSLDEADVSVALLDLLRHRFHTTRLRSTGFAIRARLRLAPEDATERIVAALPPIEGFADPPMLGGDPEVDEKAGSSRPWTITMDDVEVQHVREVWIHTVRSAGDSQVRGRWAFHPTRSLEVGPAHVESDGVDLFFGVTPLATDLKGQLTATLFPLDLQQMSGLSIFDQVSYDGQLTGRLDLAGALHAIAPRADVAFSRWEGPFDARLVMERGVLAGGSHATLDAPDTALDAGEVHLDASIHDELRVEGELATATARVTGLRALHGTTELGDVGSIDAAVTSRRLQIAHFFDDARFRLDVAAAEVRDVGALLHAIDATGAPQITSGPVTGEGHAEGSLADGWATGAADVRGQRVVLPVRSATLTADVTAHAELVRASRSERTLDLSGSRVVLTAGSAIPPAGRAFLAIPTLEATAASLKLSPSGLAGRLLVDLPRAELHDLAGLPSLLPMPRGLVLLAGSGHASARGELELPSGAMKGQAELAIRGMRARAGVTALSSDLGATVRARPDAGGHGTDLAGTTLSITQGVAGELPADGVPWWGTITLTRASLRTLGGASFDGVTHLRAKDATPATTLVAQNTAAPTWAVNIFKMPDVDAEASLHVTPGGVILRPLVARGQGSALQLDYVIHDGRADGAVLLDVGWNQLGYDLTEGSAGLVVLQPEAWFSRKAAQLRGIEARSSQEPTLGP